MTFSYKQFQNPIELVQCPIRAGTASDEMSGFAALNTAPSLPLVSHRSRIVSTFADNAGLAGKIDEFLRRSS